MAVQNTSRRTRLPRIIIDKSQISRLEALAAAAIPKAPEVADRLLGELSRGRVVATARLQPDVVTIGRHVTYRDETTGKERTVTLVYPEDADIARNRISILTPIGVALLGLCEGASIAWETRDHQTRTLTVIHVTAAESIGSPEV